MQERNATVGFAATTWFEVVPAKEVAAETAAGFVTAVYPLDPNRDSYKAKDRGLRHLKRVTLVWREGFEKSPFVFDLFLHGDLNDPNSLAIRIPALDIRKFLSQPIPFESAEVARLQAYFEEFSRKSKLIYPRPEPSEIRTGHGYDSERLEAVRNELRALLATEKGSRSRGAAPLENALTLLGAPGAVDLSAVEQNLRATIKNGREDQATSERLTRMVSMVTALTSSRNISYVKLVNNCREPGNYEIALEDALQRPLLRGSFAFSPGTYDRMLVAYDGLGIGDIGTGIRIARSVVWEDPRTYWRSLLPWNWVKSLPRARIDDLVPQHKNGATVRGAVAVTGGRIPYEHYEIEVRAKSAFQTFAEPLSYVGIDASKPMPTGFLSPDRTAPQDYWTAVQHAGRIVAHKFALFEDLHRYDVYLSGFEVNGVYIGKSDLVDFDVLRRRGRWRFDYRYLENLGHYAVWNDRDRVWIQLINDGPDASTNFLIGNLALGVGEEIEFPFGIGTQPLVSDYNANVFQVDPRLALAYGRDGRILDHHDTRIGVERIYIQRPTEDTYKVRLVAHERILPVWEGTVRIRQQVQHSYGLAPSDGSLLSPYTRDNVTRF